MKHKRFPATIAQIGMDAQVTYRSGRIERRLGSAKEPRQKGRGGGVKKTLAGALVDEKNPTARRGSSRKIKTYYEKTGTKIRSRSPQIKPLFRKRRRFSRKR